MKDNVILGIEAREILDSRGNPTVETKIKLSDKKIVKASVPAGESLGKYEAVELRDKDPQRYDGKGVLKAVENINKVIAPRFIGFNPVQQTEADRRLIKMDGTDNKSSLGANTILSVSIAVCKAGAEVKKVPVYEHVADLIGTKKYKMPKPILNLINGGKHGAGNLEFQEFHIIPFTGNTFAEKLRIGAEIYHSVEEILIRHGAIHSVGDEGGFAPNLFTNSDALGVLVEAIKTKDLVFGKDVFLGLDVAASHFYKDKKYKIRDRTLPLSPGELIEFFVELHKEYHLFLIEDPLHEDDWNNWTRLTSSIKEVIVVGDDLLATDINRVKTAIDKKACTAILVKPNQVGTITETVDVVKTAKKVNWKVVASHRSGETNDSFIADLAVGIQADLVKFGAPARGERVAKYNRLLEIEKEIEEKK